MGGGDTFLVLVGAQSALPGFAILLNLSVVEDVHASYIVIISSMVMRIN